MSAHFLVVEDDADIRETLSDVISHAGFAVVMAQHGKEALKQLERARPLGIILDMQMPVMDGRAVLKSVAQNSEWAQIPVLVFSSMSSQDLRSATVEVARKPADLDTLLKWIQRQAKKRG